MIPLGLATAPAANATTDQLTFTLDVSGPYTAGQSFGSITVEVQSSPGVADTSASGDTITLSGVPTLSGTLTQPVDINGDASWGPNDLTVTQAGSGYVLTATDTGTSTNGMGATGASGSFSVNPGQVNTLAFTNQPSNAASGAPISSPMGVQVTATDSFTNPAPNASVNVAILNNPGGGTLSGTVPQLTNGSGVATFSNLSIDKAGMGYTLTASAGIGVSKTSGSFNIAPGTATQLMWGVQPTSVVSEAHISPAVTVQALDAASNPVYPLSITIAIGTNGGGGTLSGTKIQSTVGPNGIATFADLSIDKAGNSYTLLATSGSLSSVPSNGFDVTPGPGDHLGLNPPTTTVGPGEPVAYTATELDHAGNVVNADVTSQTTFTVAGGTCSGASCSSATAGPHMVTGALTLTPAIKGTATLTVMTIAVNHLVFQQQPTTVPYKTTITPPVTVSVDNGSNTIVQNASGTITLSVVGGKAALRGTVTEPVNKGVASFPSLHIDTPGRRYQLEAVSAGRTSVASSLFNIQGPTSLSVAVSATIVGYLRHVTVTAHLAHWFTNRAVSIWYRRYPGGTPRLIQTGNVDRRGHFTATTHRLSSQVHVWATYTGDTRYLPTGSSPQNVRVRVAISASMAGGYGTSRSGFRLYHYNSSCPSRHVRCPVVTATVLPILTGEKVAFRVEARIGGVWKAAAYFNNARLGTAGSASEILFYFNRLVLFVPLRVRAEFNGDATHASNVSSWRYFEVTR